MNALGQFTEGVSRWLDSVATTIVAAAGRVSIPRTVRFEEDDTGAFVVQAGGAGVLHVQFAGGDVVAPDAAQLAALVRGTRAELVLRPARFLFRPLELPRRAADFLDGIVRAQIDRLTPWSPADAAFGCSKPAEAGTDRIAVTVAATARAQITPYVQALAGLGAQSVAVSTLGQDANGEPALIAVLDEKAQSPLDVGRVRRVVGLGLTVAGLAAASSVAAATIVAGNLSSQQDELARRIAERRAMIRAANDTGGVVLSPERRLEQRKHQVPSSVIALEALSRVLPDHTYVTEFRIEGEKLRLVGITRDAPALIRLIEESSHFTRATFFAPTTRQATDPGERFHIEAHIEPVFTPRS